MERPKIFLDKSPRIVEYQLKRLDNQRLLLVERKSDDAKYIPVYSAILTRVGMSPQYREEAVEALVKLRDSDPVIILLEALAKFDAEDRSQRRAARQITGMLLRQPGDSLAKAIEPLGDAIDADNPLVRRSGFAGLIVAGQVAEDDVLFLAHLDDGRREIVDRRPIGTTGDQEQSDHDGQEPERRHDISFDTRALGHG